MHTYIHTCDLAASYIQRVDCIALYPCFEAPKSATMCEWVLLCDTLMRVPDTLMRVRDTLIHMYIMHVCTHREKPTREGEREKEREKERKRERERKREKERER